MEDEGAVVRGSDDELRCVLLDGPIGHLDADNVKWLEHRKPKTFKGVKSNTLTMFVKEYPKKEGVLRAEQRDDEVCLPEPGLLQGKPRLWT